jgi:hypothetical protein
MCRELFSFEPMVAVISCYVINNYCVCTSVYTQYICTLYTKGHFIGFAWFYITILINEWFTRKRMIRVQINSYFYKIIIIIFQLSAPFCKSVAPIHEFHGEGQNFVRCRGHFFCAVIAKSPVSAIEVNSCTKMY